MARIVFAGRTRYRDTSSPAEQQRGRASVCFLVHLAETCVKLAAYLTGLIPEPVFDSGLSSRLSGQSAVNIKHVSGCISMSLFWKMKAIFIKRN